MTKCENKRGDGGQGNYSVCISTQSLGALGTYYPRKFMHFRLSEIASGNLKYCILCYSITQQALRMFLLSYTLIAPLIHIMVIIWLYACNNTIVSTPPY